MPKKVPKVDLALKARLEAEAAERAHAASGVKVKTAAERRIEAEEAAAAADREAALRKLSADKKKVQNAAPAVEAARLAAEKSVQAEAEAARQAAEAREAARKAAERAAAKQRAYNAARARTVNGKDEYARKYIGQNAGGSTRKHKQKAARRNRTSKR